MARLPRKRTSRSSSYWFKIIIFLFLILAILFYLALSAFLNKVSKIEYSINSLTPSPSSGTYEPPLTSRVITEVALLRPAADPKSDVIAQLVKNTPVLLLAFEEKWVKVQSSTTENVSGWALRSEFAMNEPKPAPVPTGSTPMQSPSPTSVATIQMTPPLTTTRAVTSPIAATPALTQTDQLTVVPSTAIPAPPTLIPPLELSPTPPILADAVVQAATLKLRSGPDERYADLGEIKQNTKLSVTGKTEGCYWLYVITADGTRGWVPLETVTLNINCIQIPVAPLPSGTPSTQMEQPPPLSQGVGTPHSNNKAGQSESSQSSNSSSTTQVEAKADLVASAFTIRNIGENTITFDYTIANQGTVPVTIMTQSQPLGIAIQVFLSDNQGNELFQGQTLYPPALKGLAPGRAYSASYPGRFPSATRFNLNGPLHLTLVVDAENVVNEVDENNNRKISVPLPITPTPTPQPTDTPMSTVTLTYTPLPADTPMPTATPIPTLLSIPTSVATLIPTSTPTFVTIPTATRVEQSTLTPFQPTLTPTPLNTLPPLVTPTLGSPLGLYATCNTPTSAGTPINCQATITQGIDVSYIWDFGDGASAVQGSSVTHIYGLPGDYLVTVTASNAHGSTSYKLMVWIFETPPNNVKIVHESPISVNEVSVFTATVESGIDIIFEWSFGNGTIITGGSIVHHSFTKSGVYEVRVRAYNSAGEAITSIVVTVEDKPPVILQIIDDSPKLAGQSINFTAFVLSNTQVHATWGWGDGNQSDVSSGPEQNSLSVKELRIAHSYTQSGRYLVTIDGVTQPATYLEKRSVMLALILLWEIHYCLTNPVPQLRERLLHFQLP